MEHESAANIDESLYTLRFFPSLGAIRGVQPTSGYIWQGL